MKTVKVKLFQSLFDISVQEYGTVTGVVAIAFANDLSITDELIVDTKLKIPDFENTQSKVLKYYAENKTIPATAQLTDEIETLVYDEFLDSGQTPPIYQYDPIFSEQF